MLETGESIPLGGTRAKRLDVRVVAATHVDLLAAVKAGKFREDLLERLARRAVLLPPLRERTADVPLMIANLIAATAAHARVEAPRASIELVEACMAAAWPRNVRQLRNVIEGATEAAIAAGDRVVAMRHWPPEMLGSEDAEEDVEQVEAREPARASVVPAARAADFERLRAEYAKVKNVREAARRVGISKSTAHAWLVKAGLI